nr:hypothetical protein [Tanacetum cinerariifolium]
MNSKTKQRGRQTYDTVNEKWRNVRPNVARFCGVHANVMRRAHVSGARDEDYFAMTLLDYQAEFGELQRPIGRDKAKGSKKKRVGSLGLSSSMNDEAFARLMVFDLATHNEPTIVMKKEEHAAFLEIRSREVECRERELAIQEYKQRQKDIRFYMQPYDHLAVNALLRIEGLRAEIKAKWNLLY